MTLCLKPPPADVIEYAAPQVDPPEPRPGEFGSAVAHNVMWNWAGMGVTTAAGFILAPYLVHHLGQTVYGLWILIASFNQYFRLLDIGVRGAMAREIAFYRAKNDREGLNAALNTALLILSAAGILALLGTLGVMTFFNRLFHVPPSEQWSVQVTLLLVGLNLVLWMPLNLFDSLLWAYQRFDVINAADIISSIIRVVAIFYLVGRGYGLVAVAAVNLFTLAGGQAAKMVVAFRIDRALRIGLRSVRKSSARALLGIGSWNMLLVLKDLISSQIGPPIIGLKLGVDMNTPFSIGFRLVGYARDFMENSTGVLTPVAIAYHAEERHREQKRMFLEGSKYCLALSIFFLGIFLLLGKPTITLWMGESYAWSYRLLVILAIGQVVPMSQWVAYSIILGKYRHRALAIAGVVENVVLIALALALIGPYRLEGVCWAFAISGTLFRGLFQLVYGCRLLSVSAWEYLSQVLLPVTALLAPPTLALVAMTRWHIPGNWLSLIAYTGMYAILSAAAMGVLLLTDRWRLHGRLAATARRDDASLTFQNA